jgi:nucleoside phosphorylase
LRQEELLLSNAPLPETQSSEILTILSKENILRGQDVLQKEIPEGKITLNPQSNLIHPVPLLADALSQQLVGLDRNKWDLYLVIIPFTLHKAAGNNYYERVTFVINLTTPGATAFDLFPKTITTLVNKTKTYTLSPQGRIEEVESGQKGAGGLIRFNALNPTITAFGEGESKFYWVYQGNVERKEVIPETKHALVVLRIPHGTRFVDGTISYEVVIAKKLLGGWRSTPGQVNAYTIHWELGEASSAFSVATQQKTLPPLNHNPYFDVCIVSALAEEARALMDEIASQCNVTCQKALSPQTKREYYYTTIWNVNREPLSIHISWQPSYGPVEASLHLKPILEEFRPCFAAMTGICAGDKRKVKLGDIVVAERAFFYDTGKFVSGEGGHGEYLHDTNTHHPHIDTLHFVRGFDGWKPAVASLRRPYSKHQQRDWLLNKLLDTATPRIDDIARQELEEHAPDWRKIIWELQEGTDSYLTRERTLRDPSKIHELYYGVEIFPFKDPEQPLVHVAPIASGSAIRSDSPFDEVRIPVRGTVAIDMEGATFYRTLSEFPQIRSLLVKGVSDYADSDKDDSYHYYASAMSATYLLSLIKEYVTTNRMPELRQAANADESGGTRPQGGSISSKTAQLIEPPLEDKKSDVLNVFYSYSPKDEPLRKQLEIHLAILKRQAWIKDWYAHNISGGQAIEEEISIHLKQAQIILLLISPDFLASDSCYEKEMLPALAMQEAGKARIIPILLRPTTGLKETPLDNLLVIPRNGKAVTEWGHLDRAFAEVAREIRVVVEELKRVGK